MPFRDLNLQHRPYHRNEHAAVFSTSQQDALFLLEIEGRDV